MARTPEDIADEIEDIEMEEMEDDEEGPILSDRDHAPIIYFDGVSPFGFYNGVVHLTLGAFKHIPIGRGSDEIRADLVATAFLRCNVEAAIALRDALDAALLMAAPIEGEAN
jgi:hypothetical protein